MSVWISDEKLLIFASLISPSKMILFEVRQKYSATRRIFNSLLGVSSGDETLHLMFDILLEILDQKLKQVNKIFNKIVLRGGWSFCRYSVLCIMYHYSLQCNHELTYTCTGCIIVVHSVN